MSSSHHGDGRNGDPALSELVKRFLAQVEDVGPKREYPNGRIGAEDDGALAFAVAADPKSGTVIVNFNKPVKWFGLAPKDVIALCKMLTEKAREVSKEPLVVEIG